MFVEFNTFAISDIDDLIKDVRDIDRLEFELMSNGESLHDMLSDLHAKSIRARTARVDGHVVAIYGMIRQTILGGTGNPWMIATNEIYKTNVRRAFLQNTKRELAWLAGDLNYLWNLVHSKNVIAIRWLKWIGFKFDGSGFVSGEHEFLKFYME